MGEAIDLGARCEIVCDQSAVSKLEKLATATSAVGREKTYVTVGVDGVCVRSVCKATTSGRWIQECSKQGRTLALQLFALHDTDRDRMQAAAAVPPPAVHAGAGGSAASGAGGRPPVIVAWSSSQ